MEKRLPLALFLSFLVLFGYSWFFGPRRTEVPPEPAVGAADVVPPAPAEDVAPPATPPARGPVVAGEREETRTLLLGTPGAPDRFLATFTNRGARLLELRVSGHFDHAGLGAAERGDPEHWARLLVSVDAENGPTGTFALGTNVSARALVTEPLEGALWTMEVLGSEAAPRGVEFTYAPGTGIVFVKRVLVDPGEPRLVLELEMRNELAPDDPEARGLSGPKQFLLYPASCVPRDAESGFYVEPQVFAVAPARDGKEMLSDAAVRKDDGRPPVEELETGDQPLAFVGAHNKYFAFLLRGAEEPDRATLIGARARRVRDLALARERPEEAQEAFRFIEPEVDLLLDVPDPGERATWRYVAYAGPKDRDGIAADYAPHAELTDEDLGFFSSIAALLLVVLRVYHSLVGNWGLAIILLTLTVRVLLFPVNRRSQTAMARYQTKMKRIQPRIEEIKKKHAKDPQRLRQEQARIMQEEGAFPPLGGCLPIFVQIPIFIGLFSALRTSFDLRHAPFYGWIQDLSQPDRFLRIDLPLPFFGTVEYLNILPPLMVVFWILQQRAMPKPTDEQAARMQKMMMWMPILMGFFLYSYAAGLSLYMITTSLLGLVETKVIKRYWPVDEVEKPRKPSGFMAKLSEMQKEQMRRMEEAQRRGGGRPKKARR